MEGRFSITVSRIFVLHCSSRALGSAGSVRTIGLSTNGCLHTKKACRDSGKASLSSSLDQKEDERRRCSQGCTVELTAWKCVIPLNPFPANLSQKQTLIKCPNFILRNFGKQKAPCIRQAELSLEWSFHRISSADSNVGVTLQNSIKQSGSERDFFAKECSS